MKKHPEPLQSLLYDVNNAKRAEFKKHIVEYNTLFSFASIQYDKAPVAKFGAQVAKAKGLVRHYPSAVVPNNPSRPMFANFYLYDGEAAVAERLAHPFLKNLDPEVITYFC